MRVSVFKIFKYVFLAVLLVLIVAAGILLTLDVNQYKGDLVEIVKENTGRDFKIKGDLKLALSLIPTIAVDGVSFGNAAWGSRPDMVKVGRFEARVAVMPLFSGNIKVTSFRPSSRAFQHPISAMPPWILPTMLRPFSRLVPHR